MQLLGFNYKAAIGEPLTEICANAITNLASKEVTPKLFNLEEKGNKFILELGLER